MRNQEILKVIRPFVEAKVHNPNKSTNVDTTRVINIKAIHLAKLNNLYEALSLEAPLAEQDLLSQLITRAAMLERDGRERYRASKILVEAGLVDDEMVGMADSMVTAARDRGDAFLDIERIRKSLIETYLGEDDDS